MRWPTCQESSEGALGWPALALLNGIAGPLMVLAQEAVWADSLLRVRTADLTLWAPAKHNLTFRQIPASFDDQPENPRELEHENVCCCRSRPLARFPACSGRRLLVETSQPRTPANLAESLG